MHVSSAGSNDECARIRIAPGGVRSCCPVTGGGGAQLVHLAPARWIVWTGDTATNIQMTRHFTFSAHPHTATSHSQFHTARSRRGSGNTMVVRYSNKINILLYCLFAAVTLSSPPPTPGPGTSSPRPGLHRAGLGCGVQAATGQELVHVVEDVDANVSDVARSRT